MNYGQIRTRCFHGIVITIICLSAFEKSAFADAVARAYQQAVESFDRGQDKQATQILRRIVAKYPGYRAAYYLLGRIYYRDNQITKAAKNFLLAGAGTVTSAGAFEFGVAMFSINRFDEAFKAFKKVPPKSPNRNIANFYLGVISYRRGNYTQAEFYLRRARKLPDDFVEYRTRVLRAIRGNDGTASTFQQYRMAPTAPQASKSPKPDGSKQQEEAVKRGNFLNITPKISYFYEQSKADKHGFSFNETSKRGPTGSLDLSAGSQNNPRSGLASYGVNAQVQMQRLSSTGRTVQFGKADTNVFSFETPLDNSDAFDNSYQFHIAPFTTHGIGRSSSASLDAGLVRQAALKSANASLTFFVKPGLNIDYESADWNTDLLLMRLTDALGSRLNIQATTNFDYDFDSFTAGSRVGFESESNSGSGNSFPEAGDYTSSGLGSFSSKFIIDGHASRSWENSSGKVTGSYSLLNAEKGTTGDYGAFKLASELTIQFGFGINVTGTLSYAMVPYAVRKVLSVPSDVINKVPDADRQTTKVEAAYDRLSYGARVNAAPADGALLTISVTQNTDNFTANKKENQSLLIQGTADQTLSSSFVLELGMTF